MKFLRTETKRKYMTFNSQGIGGLLIHARNKREALEIARDQWGRGAKVEYLGIGKVDVYKNE